MNLLQKAFRRTLPRFVFFACVITLGASNATVNGQEPKLTVLSIGWSDSVTTTTTDTKREEGALQTLKNFIQNETGFKNEILRQKDWLALADKMAKGLLHVGVFQGYEFAWAQEKYADLHGLAIAVSTHRYPTVHIVAKGNSPAKKFADLQGQSLALPNSSQHHVDLFVERQSQANGKTTTNFFSQITSLDNVEDALDNVVDGAVHSAAVDRAALEAYKARKPGRIKQLKVVAQSQPFPPPVVACYGKNLDAAACHRLGVGLLGAHRKETGETVLTLFRLSRFETIPDDFAKVLAQTRKTYPPPNLEAK